MPATFIINPRSGGRRGDALRRRLAARGARTAGLSGLAQAVAGADGPLIACGGDGTAAAVLDAVWRQGRDLPVGIVPLGTGNDLARCLGRLDPEDWLGDPPHCPQARLDRWRLTGPGLDRAFFNYWSVGRDAAIAGRVHAARDRHPWLFRAAWLNLGLYGLSSLQEGGGRLDGATDLPDGTGLLVAASIPSYAAGCRLAPDIRADDGILDVFSAPDALPDLGLLLSGRRRARRLGRRTELRLVLRRPAPMQVDGEPFRAAAGAWWARREGQVRVLSPRGR